eukprot:XP_002938953.2 PREDICTED: myomesin-1 [Xenopus tropicalis]
MSLPFYQKHHHHYDRGYRSTDLQSTLSQYQHEEKRQSASRSSHLGLKSSYTMREDRSQKLSPRAKRTKHLTPFEDKENEGVDYVVPIFRGRQEYVSGITDTEEDRIMETAGYVARRNLFSTGEGISVSRASSSLSEHSEHYQKKSRSVEIREKAERLALKKTIDDTEDFHRKINEDMLLHAPIFIIKPRSHTIWETQNVKLHCTVSGWPEPRVTWYKNNVPIDDQAHPEKYKIEGGYGIHSLEIFKCDFEDTAQYHASAMNVKGENSAYASLVVKRYKGDLDDSAFPPKSTPFSFSVTPYGFASKFDIHFVDSFGVSFGKEGETLSLGSKVIIHPTIKRFQPEIQWYKNGVLLSPSKWRNMHWSGEHSTLTLTHLNKEDEGLYTLRAVMGEYYEQYSAYVFVRDAEAEVAGAPAAPLDVECLDANKDYVIISWKQPAVDGGSSILGYFIDRFIGYNGAGLCVAGIDNWQRVNTEIPVKSPRFALFDLAEGKSYSFRVRSCNSAGVGEPSEATEATVVGDKLDIPPPASNIIPTRNTDTSVVVTWTESKDARELVGYYIEASIAGSGHWEPCNNNPVKGKRFICHGLLTGQKYVFRVRAVNAAGLSDYSSDSEAIEVKAAIGGGLPHATPSPPYDITILESVRDSMVLGWKEPKITGGLDIKGYYVNFREVIDGVAGQWHEANIKAISERAYRILNLKENTVYQYEVMACNLAGVGTPSQPSKPFKCEEWTIAVPGPPHQLTLREVRSTSMVLLWQPPVYTGRNPVTGYYIDIKEADAGDERWRGVNEKQTANKYIKIVDLQEGARYVLRVRAVNQAGVGKSSDLTDPVLAQTKPGTKEVEVIVDDDGIISLNFECDQLTPDSKFIWSKNYEPIDDDSSRVSVETKGGRTKVSFKDPSEEDLGIYSCVVTETDGVSSSYTLDAEELKRLLQLSHDNKYPVIPLKSELAVEILEKGQVRFWMQAEKLSPNAKVNHVFNDKEIKDGDKYNMSMDRNTGIAQMVMEKLEDEDEGTYTFQLQDGKATNQSSLVLIGDVFEKLKKEARFQRQEWIRKQGPHFVEYLGWEVTPECNVLLKSKVANIRNDTNISWYIDEREIMEDEKHEFKDGVCTLLITEFTKKDAGVYELILRDDRGKDKSVLKLMDSAFDDLMSAVCKVIAESASQLKIQSNEEGIRLYTFVNYFVDDLKVSWCHNDGKIKYTDRVKTGVTGEMIWLQINEPTPNDKGKYVLEMFDGKSTHTRDVDLSGQAYDEAFAEFQRLKQAAIAEKNRARVTGGLPDVVTIQEGKALNLTCNIWGDPVPEVTWLKNERELIGDDHCILKFEAGKYASFTITCVSTTDSGKYAIRAKNKYGTETNDFTLIVTHMMGELGMAMYVADAAGHVMETVTPGKKKEPKSKFRTKEVSKQDLVKPHVEEIVATEETPGPDEKPIVEEEDNGKQK